MYLLSRKNKGRLTVDKLDVEPQKNGVFNYDFMVTFSPEIVIMAMIEDYDRQANSTSELTYFKGDLFVSGDESLLKNIAAVVEVHTQIMEGAIAKNPSQWPKGWPKAGMVIHLKQKFLL